MDEKKNNLFLSIDDKHKKIIVVVGFISIILIFFSGYFKSDGDKKNTDIKNEITTQEYTKQLENNLKSILSYVMSKNHGFKEQSYLNADNFVDDPTKTKQINDLLRKMKRQINVNSKQHTATSHYMINYGYIPLWVVVKVLSFGIVGELYSILQYEDQKEIANIYDIDVKELILYLPIIANYRNLCAHEDMCFMNKTQKIINNTKYHDLLNIKKNEYGEYEQGVNDLFSLIIILKQVLTEEDFSLMMSEISYEIDVLDGKLEVIGIEKILFEMGFPINYKEIVRVD